MLSSVQKLFVKQKELAVFFTFNAEECQILRKILQNRSIGEENLKEIEFKNNVLAGIEEGLKLLDKKGRKK